MGELVALGAAFSWAFAVTLVRIAPPSIPVSQMNAIRLLVPAVTTPMLMFAFGMQGELMELRWQNFAALAVSVITGVGAGDMLLFRAIRTVGLVRSYTIGGTFPLFALLFAALLLGEEIGGFAIAGTLLIVTGGALVSTRSTAEEQVPHASRWQYRRGLALSLVVAMMWGIDIILLKIGAGDAHPFVANSFRMPLAAAMTMAFAWRVSGRFPLLRVNTRTAVTLALSGLLGLTVGSYLFLLSIQEIGAARTGALGAFSPVFAMILAVAFLRERPGWKAILGTLVATGGVVLLTLL